MNEDLLLNQHKYPHCKIEIQSFSHNLLECSRCGLADTKLLLMDYHNFFNSYLEPSKQTFDHEKHFAQWINNILGINTPKKDIMPILWKYIEQNNIKQISIESLRLTLKQLKLAQYYQYTSYFYKELTGVELPITPRDIINKAKWYFNKFYKARKKKKRLVEGKLPKNKPQYFYLICTIFYLILVDEEKRRILQFIYLPSKVTLLKRKQEWNLILDLF